MPLCPVCTVTVCAAVGLSRWLKLDDLISGLWIGAIILTMVLATLHWLARRNLQSWLIKILTFILFYGSVYLTLDKANFIGIADNCVASIDKLIVGIAAGSIIFAESLYLHLWLKNKHHNRVYFPFQKVIIPVAQLLIFSIIFFFLLK